MKLNIKTKLIGGFLVVVGLMVLVGVIGWNGLSTLNAATDHICTSSCPKTRSCETWSSRWRFKASFTSSTP